jgi:hypothetical protein
MRWEEVSDEGHDDWLRTACLDHEGRLMPIRLDPARSRGGIVLTSSLDSQPGERLKSIRRSIALGTAVCGLRSFDRRSCLL